MEPTSTSVPKNLEILFGKNYGQNEKILYENISSFVIQALSKSDYEAFDAHVKDRACQCRVILLHEILTNNTLPELMAMVGSETLPQPFITLIQMYICHLTRVQTPLPDFNFKDESDHMKLVMLSSKLTEKKCDRIVKDAQKELAQKSAALTKRLLNKPDLPTSIDGGGRILTETRFHIRAIIQVVKTKSIPIVVLRAFIGEATREKHIFVKSTAKHLLVTNQVKLGFALCIEANANRGGVDQIATTSITKMIKQNGDNYGKATDILPHTLIIKHIRACAL